MIDFAGRGKHLSDEQLLAYFDGETGQVERYRTRLHLFRCWSCRSRLMAFRETVRTLCGAYHEAAGDDQAGNARQEWMALLAPPATENNSPTRTGVGGRSRRISPRWALAAAAVAAVLAIAGVLTLPARRETSVPALRTASRPSQVALPAIPQTAPNPAVPSATPDQPSAAVLDDDTIEARAQYVLHTLGVCRGEPVQLERRLGRNTGWRITGNVPRPERRDEIAAALSAAGLRSFVTVDLDSGDAAIPLPAAPVAGAAMADPVTPVARAAIVPEAELKRYFRSLGVEDSERLRDEVTRYAGQAFQLSGKAQIESAALRQLAGRWSERALDRLEPTEAALIRTMTLAHLAELSEALDGLDLLLRPVLGGGTGSPVVPAGAAPGAGSWQQSAVELRAELLNTHRLVAGLFAGDRLPGELSAPDRAAAALYQSVQRLRAELPAFEREARAALAPQNARKDPR
jgi:hypothetical protein